MSMEETIQKLKADSESQVQTAIEFMQHYRESNGISRAVIGISGGADSTLTAYVMKQAGYSVTGIIMPTKVTSTIDLEHAEMVCEKLGLGKKTIDIQPIVDSAAKQTGTTGRVALGNMMARTRMIVLYSHSNENSAIVAGTGDKSEYLLGYFTKYGDAGCDVFPILHCYKTQVREFLGSNGFEEIAEKKPSPGLWENQVAEGELRIDYETADGILEAIVDRDSETLKEIDPEKIARVLELYKSSRHKRALLSLFNVAEIEAIEQFARED